MKADIREKYKPIFEEHFGQARVITATTCIAALRAWKPGGVTLAILGPWAQHVAKTSCDDLGCWVSATLTGSDGDSFTLFSMYNVVNKNLRDAGPSTVFSQQYRLLGLAGGTYPVPRQQCVDDLNLAVRRLIADNDSIVTVGDFNEILGTNPKLMASVCAKHNLFHVHDHFHGIGANIPTYARGTKWLDYGVASPNLEPYIGAWEYNLFNEHLHSDHRASFMDIRQKEFFGHDTPRLASEDLRSMSTSSPDVLKFVQKMYAHLDENKAFHQYQDFCLDVDVVDKPWLQANHLDTMLGQAIKTAEKQCSKHPRPPWLEKLHHATLRVRYWKIVFTERRTRVSQATVLRRLVAEIWLGKTPPTIPRSTRILQNVATPAQSTLRRVRQHAVKERGNSFYRN
jgi:hypothetical protein